MNGTKEIKRCRRDAEERRYQAAELDARADALEARDRVYRESLKASGFPLEETPGLIQKARTVVARLKGATA